jgi:hypothetical protein
MESAAAFYETLENDTALMERIAKMTPKEAEKLVKEELQYDFTREEMQKVIFQRYPEMTDQELEIVTGGFANETEAFLVGSAVGMGAVGSVAIFLGAATAAAA